MWEGCKGRTHRPEEYIWFGLVLSFVHLLFAAVARSPAVTHWTGGPAEWGRRGLHRGEGKEGVSGIWVLMTLSVLSSGCFNLPNEHQHLLAKQSACLRGKKGWDEWMLCALFGEEKSPNPWWIPRAKAWEEGLWYWGGQHQCLCSESPPLKTMGNRRPTGPLSQWRALCLP